MNLFNHIKEKLERKTPTFSSDICDFYQERNHWYPKYVHDWGCAYIYHFKCSDSFENSFDELKLWDDLVVKHPELRLELVPIYDVGQNYIVQCAEPLDGYTTSMYEEHLSLGGFHPPNGFVESHVILVEEINQLISKETPEITALLKKYLLSPNTCLFFQEKSNSWLLFRLDLRQVFL